MYWHKTPVLLAKVFPDILWKVETKANEIYLTFDDGPIPGATEWVVDELDKFSAKASFFMVGENVFKYDEIYQKVKNGGHAIGNHTYNHLNGWQHSNQVYLDNVVQCSGLLPNGLFRPPHGRMKWGQYKELKQSQKVVMWDVLSGDFDQALSKERCLKNCIEATSRGTIIVFHDSLKSIEKLKYVLPRYLDHFADKGFHFKPL